MLTFTPWGWTKTGSRRPAGLYGGSCACSPPARDEAGRPDAMLGAFVAVAK